MLVPTDVTCNATRVTDLFWLPVRVAFVLDGVHTDTYSLPLSI